MLHTLVYDTDIWAVDGPSGKQLLMFCECDGYTVVDEGMPHFESTVIDALRILGVTKITPNAWEQLKTEIRKNIKKA